MKETKTFVTPTLQEHVSKVFRNLRKKLESSHVTRLLLKEQGENGVEDEL